MMIDVIKPDYSFVLDPWNFNFDGVYEYFLDGIDLSIKIMEYSKYKEQLKTNVNYSGEEIEKVDLSEDDYMVIIWTKSPKSLKYSLIVPSAKYKLSDEVILKQTIFYAIGKILREIA